MGQVVLFMETMSLRQARMRKVLTVRGLAKAAGLAPATIYHIEHRRTRPQFRSIRAISTALGVEPAQITEFAEVIEEEAAPTPIALDRRSTRRSSP